MDNRIALLEEDLKNARNMIDCLNRTVETLTKVEKPATNDDSSSKLAQILQKLENKIDVLTSRNEELSGKLADSIGHTKTMEDILKKIDHMQEELDKSQGYIAHFVESHGKMSETLKEITAKVDHGVEETKNFQKLDKIVDTVDTTQGYVELFVKDFDKIHSKIDSIDDVVEKAFDKMEKTFTRNLDVLSNDIQGTNSKIEKNEGNVLKSIENVDGIVGQAVVKMETAFQEQLERVSNNIRSIHSKVNNTEGSVETVKVQVEGVGRILTAIMKDLGAQKSDCSTSLTILNKLDKELLLNIKTVDQKIGYLLKGPVYKCRRCNSVLPSEPLRPDGVSVSCKCNAGVIIGKLKEGHKWTSIILEGSTKWCGHYNEIPTETQYGGAKTCEICRKAGKTDATYITAVCVYDGK